MRKLIPVQINGADAHYFIDTGAVVSAIGESEAARLGLTLPESRGSVATSTTQPASYRAAVAKEVEIGVCCWETHSTLLKMAPLLTRPTVSVACKRVHTHIRVAPFGYD